VVAYFALIPVIGLVAWLAPRVAYRRAMQEATEVYIAEHGVYLRGALHTWKQPFSSLRRVRFERKSNPPVLSFVLRHLTRVGWVHYQTEVLDVRVPQGHEAAAERVERFFATH
jgi:hypothetical protein